MSENKTSASNSNGSDKHDPHRGSADHLTQRNVESILRLEEAAKEERTQSDRMAEVIAKFCGSMTFVWVHVVWFGGWIVLNLLPWTRHIDPFPFTLHARRFARGDFPIHFYFN